ncbi:hypothetical protein H4582DRAFT_2057984 [Lactarius indigo]|nr:hypothetical protein H4582DRAFT_2057984 [Lactarius indigo]
MVTQPDDHVFDSVMDEMLQYTTTDRILMVSPTLDWVLGILEHRAYLDGTRYYETAECFLFFAAQLLRATPDPGLHARLAPLLRVRIQERTGVAVGDALALAMRVLAGSVVGLHLAHDLAALLSLQYEDGSWGPGWMYKYGSSGVKIGNRGLTTALALDAIAALRSLPRPQPSEPIRTTEKRALLPLGFPLSQVPPLSLVGEKKERVFSVGAIVRTVYAYVFSVARINTRRLVQDERGGSIGAS